MSIWILTVIQTKLRRMHGAEWIHRPNGSIAIVCLCVCVCVCVRASPVS